MVRRTTRRITSGPVVGQGVLDLPGMEGTLYPVQARTSARTHVVGVDAPDQEVSWVDVRRMHLLRALGALHEHNTRIGAGKMSKNNPNALRIDRRYSGGRAGIAARAEGFEVAYVHELGQACGACALRDQCTLAGPDGADPKAFDNRFHYALARSKLTAALALNPSVNCSTVAVQVVSRAQSA